MKDEQLRHLLKDTRRVIRGYVPEDLIPKDLLDDLSGSEYGVSTKEAMERAIRVIDEHARKQGVSKLRSTREGEPVTFGRGSNYVAENEDGSCKIGTGGLTTVPNKNEGKPYYEPKNVVKNLRKYLESNPLENKNKRRPSP